MEAVSHPAYALGKNKYGGGEPVKATYRVSLPKGVITGNEARVTLTATDPTLSISYLEAVIGDKPTFKEI